MCTLWQAKTQCLWVPCSSIRTPFLDSRASFRCVILACYRPAHGVLYPIRRPLGLGRRRSPPSAALPRSAESLAHLTHFLGNEDEALAKGAADHDRRLKVCALRPSKTGRSKAATEMSFFTWRAPSDRRTALQPLQPIPGDGRHAPLFRRPAPPHLDHLAESGFVMTSSYCHGHFHRPPATLQSRLRKASPQRCRCATLRHGLRRGH